MNFLFWNLNGNDLTAHVRSIVSDKDIDVVILAEHSGVNPTALVRSLSSIGPPSYYFHNSIAQQRIRIFSRLPGAAVTPVSDSGGIAVRRIDPPASDDLLLVAVHCQSKLYWSTPADSFAICTRIRAEIESAEKLHGHTRSIIVGDLNVDPFEDGLANSEGLHAVMSKCVARNRQRIVADQVRPFFYNPMWSKFGDLSHGPPGSYYYARSTSDCRFWHLYDQVLLRPALIECFDSTKLELVTHAGSRQLANKNGRPKKNTVSDHFPLVFTLETTKSTNNDH